MNSRRGAALALAAVTVIWGWTFVAVKEALELIPPLELVGIRFLLATAALAIISGLRSSPPTEVTEGPRLLITAGTTAGLALLAGYATQTMGLVYTGATRSGFITGMTVVFVPLVEGISRKRWPGSTTATGILVATLGLFMLTGGLSDAESEGLNSGDLLTIGTAIAFAVHVVTLGWASPRCDPLLLTVIQLSVAAVGSLAASAVFEKMVVPPTSTWMAIGITAFGASAGAFLIMTWAQRHLSASEAGIILTLEPVFAGMAGYFLLEERLGKVGAMGAALILGATLWVTLQPGRETFLKVANKYQERR